jgi:hypothetical protein
LNQVCIRSSKSHAVTFSSFFSFFSM